MKAVVRESTIKGEEKQFLEVCGCMSSPNTVTQSEKRLYFTLFPLIDSPVFYLCFSRNPCLYLYKIGYYPWGKFYFKHLDFKYENKFRQWNVNKNVTFQIWSKNIKMKSINLTALNKHGKVYDDGKLWLFLFFLFFILTCTVAVAFAVLFHFYRVPQNSLAAWFGHTRRPISCTWQKGKDPRQNPTSR